MVFDNLLIEDLSLVNFLQEAIHALLVVYVPLTLLLLKLGLLVTQLHQQSLMLGPLGLYLIVQVIIFVFYLTHLLIWQVDSPEDVWL